MWVLLGWAIYSVCLGSYNICLEESSLFLILLTYGFQGYGTEGESCISRKFDRETVLKLSQFFGPQLRVAWSKKKKNRTSFFQWTWAKILTKIFTVYFLKNSNTSSHSQLNELNYPCWSTCLVPRWDSTEAGRGSSMEAAADEEQPGVGCSRAAGRRWELECRAHALLLSSLVWPCYVASWPLCRSLWIPC